MRKIFTIFSTLLLSVISFAQQTDTSSLTNTCSLRISLLTCSPGTELYSTFGHTAIRITDATSSTDIIYNYGTFNFDDPDFYTKFTRGKLLYFVSEETVPDFLYQYQYEQRSVTEQVLALSCEQKQQLYAALQENAKEEHKYYKYDFVYDNCTTRLRDLILKYAGTGSVTKNIRPYEGVTFRDLIHEYLNKSQQYWSKLGIDIVLGSPLDKKITNTEAQFLPDYFLKGLDSTSVNGQRLIEEKKIILPAASVISSKPFFTPFVVFSLLFLLIAALSFIRAAQPALAIFDSFLFFICGLLGLLLLFMWFGTDHLTTKNNFNLIWAFPGHIIAAFALFKKRKWLRKYFIANNIVLILFIAFWKALPQEINTDLFPLVALLLFRSIVRLFKQSL